MVIPTTAHAAFHKAAHYFGVEVIMIDVDPVTFRADPGAMADAIREDTVLIVGSAPSYAHGVIDPIPEIAAIAADRGLRCHVDACIGGWVLPYAPRLGREVPPWTFAVDGVTSISADLHKYGYAAKGVTRGGVWAQCRPDDAPASTTYTSPLTSGRSGAGPSTMPSRTNTWAPTLA